MHILPIYFSPYTTPPRLCPWTLLETGLKH